jgi:hypothetical protein
MTGLLTSLLGHHGAIAAFLLGALERRIGSEA